MVAVTDATPSVVTPVRTTVAESHSYVETRYGCPLTGGCLELIDRSASKVSLGNPEATR